MKYPKIDSLDSDYRHYLGLIGAYNILYGHKVERNLQRKATYIWKALLRQYGYGGYTTGKNGRIVSV